MNFGDARRVVVCAPDVVGVPSPVPCDGVASAGYALRVVDGVLLSADHAASLAAILGPYEPARGALLWSWGFGLVLGCWAVAHGVGMVLRMVRSG